MKFKQLIILLVTVNLLGCSSGLPTFWESTLFESTHLIQPDEPLHIKKYAILYKKDFQEVDISEFHTSRDSIKVIHNDTNELLEYSKSDINKIVIKNRPKGSLIGALFIVTVATVGVATVIFLIALEEDPDESFVSINKDFFSVFAHLYAIIGAIGGFSEGYKEIYVFDTPESNNINSDNTDNLHLN